MNHSIKKKIVSTIVLIIISSHFLLFSCLVFHPKDLYWTICYYLEYDNDKSVCGKINSIIAGVKECVTSHPLLCGITKNDLKLYWIDLWGYVQKELGIIYFPGVDQDMILCGKHLIFSTTNLDGIPSLITTEAYCQKLKEVYQYFCEQNIEFLHIIFPRHIHQKTALPCGLKNNFNQICTEIINGLKENDIPVIDTRELFKDSPDAHYHLFYNEDHHWIPEYAYRVYIYISQELEKQHSPMAKYFNRDNMSWNDYYIEERIPPFHDILGSYMRRVGRYYLPERDITPYMIPRYETNYTFQVPLKDINKTGSVNDTFLEYFINEPIEIIINNRVSNKNKIFVFHDSFIHSFAPFWATNNHCLYMIDMRHFQGNAIDLIEKEKPDVIFFAYSRWAPFSHIELLERQIQEKQKLNNTSKND